MKNKNQPENGEKNGDLHSFWENLHSFFWAEISEILDENKNQPENGEKNGDLHSFWEKLHPFFEQKFRKIEMKNKNQPENGEKNGDLHSFWEHLHSFFEQKFQKFCQRKQKAAGEWRKEWRSPFFLRKSPFFFLGGNFGNFGWKTKISRRMEKRMEISILFGKLSILFFERKFWMKNKHQPENGEKNGDIHSFWEISNHFFKRKFQKFWMKNKNQRENGEKNGDLHSFWENLQSFF